MQPQLFPLRQPIPVLTEAEGDAQTFFNLILSYLVCALFSDLHPDLSPCHVAITFFFFFSLSCLAAAVSSSLEEPSIFMQVLSAPFCCLHFPGSDI